MSTFRDVQSEREITDSADWAYWTGRLATALDAVLHPADPDSLVGSPEIARQVAVETLNHYRELVRRHDTTARNRSAQRVAGLRAFSEALR